MAGSLRSASERRKTERYAGFVTDHTKKSPPANDEHDVRYDFKEDTVCQVKFATDRISWWVSTLQLVHSSCETNDLDGKGTQIRITNGVYKGTVIDLMNDSGLILIKGVDPLKWADDEYPKVRDANPRLPPDLDSQDPGDSSVIIGDTQEQKSVTDPRCTCSEEVRLVCTCLDDSITLAKERYKQSEHEKSVTPTTHATSISEVTRPLEPQSVGI